MATDSTERLASSLADAGVECTRVEAGGFEAALDDAVDAPAVGAPLDVEGVSLEDTVVEVPPTPRRLDGAETGVTRVHGGVVEHGSFVVRSDAAGTEPVSLYPRKHVGVLRASDLYEDVDAAASWLREAFEDGRSAVLATGASSTADMGELVEGVHGPQTVHAVVLTDR